jgi:hypothetical protein
MRFQGVPSPSDSPADLGLDALFRIVSRQLAPVQLLAIRFEGLYQLRVVGNALSQERDSLRISGHRIVQN